MLNVLQTYRKNAIPSARRGTLLLVLAAVLVFAEGCSRKMPCPDTSQATKQAKGTKKKKKKEEVKPQAPADGEENAEASAASTTPAEEESSGSEAAAKPKISVKKNRYNKNGLLTKSKYKRLRSNPARKTSRVKKGFFARLFSGDKKKKSKSTAAPVTE